jgi:hypothetical protein
VNFQQIVSFRKYLIIRSLHNSEVGNN